MNCFGFAIQRRAVVLPHAVDGYGPPLDFPARITGTALRCPTGVTPGSRFIETSSHNGTPKPTNKSQNWSPRWAWVPVFGASSDHILDIASFVSQRRQSLSLGAAGRFDPPKSPAAQGNDRRASRRVRPLVWGNGRVRDYFGGGGAVVVAVGSTASPADSFRLPCPSMPGLDLQ